MKKFQATIIAMVLILTMFLSGCSKDTGISQWIDDFFPAPNNVVLSMPPNSIPPPPPPSPDFTSINNLDVYWDATVSMKGFTELSVGNVYSTLPDKLGDMSDGKVNFFYFGEQITPMERRDHLKLRYSEFYTESVTSFGSVLEEANTENLSVVITDLFESDADWSNITQKLREKYFNQHLAVAIIGIKNSFRGKIYDVGINAASFDYDSGDDSSLFRPFYLFLMGSDAQIRTFLSKWSKKDLPKTEVVVFSEHFTDQPVNLRIDEKKSSENIYGVSKLQKADDRLQEQAVADWGKDVSISIPTKFVLYPENCIVKELKSKVKIFAMNDDGTWQEQNNTADKVDFIGSKNGENYDYELTLKFKPESTLPFGKIGLVQVQIVIPQDSIEVPEWITKWDMGNIDIAPENFDGSKTVNLKSIAESLKGSMLTDAQAKISEFDLVIDGRR